MPIDFSEQKLTANQSSERETNKYDNIAVIL